MVMPCAEIDIELMGSPLSSEPTPRLMLPLGPTLMLMLPVGSSVIHWLLSKSSNVPRMIFTSRALSGSVCMKTPW